MATVSPTLEDVQKIMRAFLLDVMPAGWEAIEGADNRVPEPKGKEFVVMSPLRLARLRTNLHTSEDVKFTGSMLGTAMTVTAVDFGTIEVGARIFGTDVAQGTVVVSGPGGVGSYVISPSQTISSRILSAGHLSIEQGEELVMQLDFHSDTYSSGDVAAIFTTLFRDEYAYDFFQDRNAAVAPLFGDEPKQLGFLNEAQQNEWRWVVEAHMQVNATVRVPQQYADSFTLTLRNVDASFPP